MLIVTKNAHETAALAKKIASGLRGSETLALIGELGSGKTTFVKALARALGVRDTVRSPSFVLMVPYRVHRRTKKLTRRVIPNKPRASRGISWLVHVDAYRLKNTRQLKNIGLEEYLDQPDTVTVIEWADRVRGLLPRRSKIFTFRHGRSEKERIINID